FPDFQRPRGASLAATLRRCCAASMAAWPVARGSCVLLSRATAHIRRVLEVEEFRVPQPPEAYRTSPACGLRCRRSIVLDTRGYRGRLLDAARDRAVELEAPARIRDQCDSAAGGFLPRSLSASGVPRAHTPPDPAPG